VGNTKPPQWDGKKGDSYLMWKIKYTVHMVMLGLDDTLNPDFERELPTKEKDTFNLIPDEGKNWANAVKKNKKAMMQFTLSFTKVAQLNKLNHAGRTNIDVQEEPIKIGHPERHMKS
jgi:hypothetical protein